MARSHSTTELLPLVLRFYSTCVFVANSLHPHWHPLVVILFSGRASYSITHSADCECPASDGHFVPNYDLNPQAQIRRETQFSPPRPTSHAGTPGLRIGSCETRRSQRKGRCLVGIRKAVVHQMEEGGTFAGYTIPTRLRAGRHFGTGRFESEGEFFRATVDDAAYR